MNKFIMVNVVFLSLLVQGCATSDWQMGRSGTEAETPTASVDKKPGKTLTMYYFQPGEGQNHSPLTVEVPLEVSHAQ